MAEIKITIYGEPVPQGRPRFTRTGHAYDPKKSADYKKLAKLWITQALKRIDNFKPFDSALCVDLVFYLGVPASWTKKRRLEAVQGAMRPIVKNGDIDNMVKAVLDACNGLAWVDDCIVTDLTAKKRYTGDIARVEMKITEVK